MLIIVKYYGIVFIIGKIICFYMYTFLLIKKETERNAHCNSDR